jgi:hypothetical protein
MNTYTRHLLQAKNFGLFALALGVLLLLPFIVLAHQPRITESRLTEVSDPEISKAYYGTLSGEPDVYVIEASEAFGLYVGILVPDTRNPKKDVTARVMKDDEVLTVIGGEDAEWKAFFEPFGQSTYWDGGEYKARAEAGSYSVVVTSTNNDSKYSLAIGEIEAFDGREGMNALNLIPELKRDFFEESPISFIKSPFGWGLIVVMYLLAGIIGFALKYVFKKIPHSKPITVSLSNPSSTTHNIGRNDRLLRLAIGVALLLWAITTTWSPVLIFLSGFALFESIFSWCAVYQLVGKNTCEI